MPVYVRKRATARLNAFRHAASCRSPRRAYLAGWWTLAAVLLPLARSASEAALAACDPPVRYDAAGPKARSRHTSDRPRRRPAIEALLLLNGMAQVEFAGRTDILQTTIH